MAPASATSRAIPAALSRGQVHLWVARLDLGLARCPSLEDTLTEDERQRAGRFRFEGDRLGFLASRAALRDILARYLGVGPDGVEFRLGPYGQPSLHLEPGARRLRFSHSRCREVALVAVTEGRAVGVDVERVRYTAATREVAARFFSAREQETLESRSGSAREQLFFRYWTAKEAYLKATGEGLARGLEEVELSVEPSGARLLRTPQGRTAGRPRWDIRFLEPAPGYVAALAVAGRRWRLRTVNYDATF